MLFGYFFVMLLRCQFVASGPAIVLKHATSTAVYPKVDLEPETTISLEFIGDHLQGRLLYAENATMGAFLSLKLVRPGLLRLEMRLQSLNQSFPASDQFILLSVTLDKKVKHWQSVELRIRLRENQVVLLVDGKNAFPAQIPGTGLKSADRHSLGSEMFLGRVPAYIADNQSHIGYFTATMEPSFRGEIRNFLVNGRAMQPVGFVNGAEIAPGLSFCDQDSHSHRDFCPEESICRDQNDGWSCGSPKASSNQPNRANLNFNGAGWLQFVPNSAQKVKELSVSLRFKTSQRKGLLFATEHMVPNQPMMFFTLANDSVAIYNSIGNHLKSLQCLSAYNICSDYLWHLMSIKFTETHVHIKIDNNDFKIENPDKFYRIGTKRLYFGGIPSGKHDDIKHRRTLPSFSGCIQHIYYGSPVGKIDLIELIRTHGDRSETEIGQIDLSAATITVCPSSRYAKRSVPIVPHVLTFSKPGGYLQTANGWRTVSTGKIKFTLRTFLRNCLLLFSYSGWRMGPTHRIPKENQLILPIVSGHASTGNDVFSAELREGYLVFLLNTGSGINEFSTEDIWRGRQKRNRLYVADGTAHSVEIRLRNGSLSVVLDGQLSAMRPMTQPKYTVLNLDGNLYIGGVPDHVRNEAPPQVWSSNLRNDFIGCISDLTVDEVFLDLSLEATAIWARGRINASSRCPDGGVCYAGSSVCSPGRCLETSWNTPICDCTDTNNNGKDCHQDSGILSFNGFQGIGINFARLPRQSESEDLILRIQNFQKDAMVFESSSTYSTAPDRFGVQIVNGRIVVFYNLGTETKKYETARIDSSGFWHTLRVRRRSRRLEVAFDNATFSYNLEDAVSLLDCDFAYLGALIDDEYWQTASRKNPDAFVGRLSQFHWNGINILEILEGFSARRATTEISLSPASFDAWRKMLTVTASNEPSERINAFPVQFKSGGGVLGIPLNGFEPGNGITIDFSIKTGTGYGVLALLVASNDDFIGVELLQDQLFIRYRLESLRGESAIHDFPLINDTKWHDLQLEIHTSNKFSVKLKIDDTSHIPNGMLPDATISTHPAFEMLYLGGLDEQLKENIRFQFQSQYGYEGCLANLGVTYGSFDDLWEETSTPKKSVDNFKFPPKNPLRISNSSQGLAPGCSLLRMRSESGHCSPSLCGFRGRCIQQLDTHLCDCSMSGFSGTTCTQVPAALKFSTLQQGCAVFEFSPMRNTSRDIIAFGIQTTQKTAANLVYISSSSNSRDFLRIELIQHRATSGLRLTFNMGGGIREAKETRIDMSDGAYRVVRVIRDNARVQLHIDSWEPKDLMSTGANGSHFNDVHQIFIGCVPPNPVFNSITSPDSRFEGHLGGINYNGISLADLLIGETEPGIFIKSANGISVDSKFTPKLQKITNLPANDMSEEQPNPSRPLVVAKPICHDNSPDMLNKLAACKPNNPNGIVVPKWNLPLIRQLSKDVPGGIVLNNDRNLLGQNTPSFAEGDSGNIFSTDREYVFPTWSHDKATQDDVPRLSGHHDKTQSLQDASIPAEILSEHKPRSPFINIWLLIVGCCGVILLISLLIVYGVYKLRRRNGGSYNVHENRTFANQRYVTSIMTTSGAINANCVDNGTELTTLPASDTEANSPLKEWYV